MEYRFTRNDLDQPVARLNMEAEAFSHWLNIEMGSTNLVTLKRLATAVSELLAGKRWQYELEGREFFLELSRVQATVSANSVLQQRSQAEGEPTAIDELDEYDEYEADFSDEFDEGGYQETDSGLVASCGLDDFQTLLRAWVAYLED
ncbi:MAG: YacL family protein [Oceanospirillaceae bacterium]|nr:YacL family protein [Oceanospirillaceae bacterium]